MGDEAAHADGNVVGDPKWAIPAAIIKDRARADEDTMPDIDMARKAGAGADLGIIADSIIVPDDAMSVNNTALAQSGIRADVGEGTNERSLAEESATTDDGTRRDDSGKVQLRVILMESAPVAIVADRDDTIPFAESGWIKIGLPEGLEFAHCRATVAGDQLELPVTDYARRGDHILCVSGTAEDKKLFTHADSLNGLCLFAQDSFGGDRRG